MKPLQVPGRARPPEERVVATGFGMVTPLGGSVEATWAACVEGRSGVREIRGFDATGLTCRVGGEVDDAWITERDSDERDGPATRCHRLLLTAARQAASAARLD